MCLLRNVHKYSLLETWLRQVSEQVIDSLFAASELAFASKQAGALMMKLHKDR